MEKERNHQSVDWLGYFNSIKEQCPWSYAAYLKGRIDIVQYQGAKLALGDYSARMYVVTESDAVLASIAEQFDSENTEYEWLYSHPGFGEYATPVSVLIQQSRAELNAIRTRLSD